MSLLPWASYRNQSLINRRRRHEALAGYLFVLPAILGILFLVIGPMIGAAETLADVPDDDERLAAVIALVRQMLAPLRTAPG